MVEGYKGVGPRSAAPLNGASKRDSVYLASRGYVIAPGSGRDAVRAVRDRARTSAPNRDSRRKRTRSRQPDPNRRSTLARDPHRGADSTLGGCAPRVRARGSRRELDDVAQPFEGSREPRLHRSRRHAEDVRSLAFGEIEQVTEEHDLPVL